MRRGALAILLISLVALFLLIRSVSTLLSLLFETAAADAIRCAELPSSNSVEQSPQVIPKIIHQTYINETIPERWVDAQQSCIELHPDYEYIFWTDEKARNFIAAEYSWFLETFDGYDYAIQRADAIRYFVLAHYGGIYIDMDNTCNRRLDPLLAFPAWLPRTVPTGISNDAMGSIPQHPFFLRVIEALQGYDHHWPLPYITVMYSTGPLFLSVLWKEYMHAHPSDANRIRILMPDEYNRNSWSFFTHGIGNSWHGQDAPFIFWMGEHWVFLTLCAIILVCAAGFCLFRAGDRIRTIATTTGYRYRWMYTQVPANHLSASPLSVLTWRRVRYVIPTLFGKATSEVAEDPESACELGHLKD
ncbi:nucleotide-diphospho-sugar transferase [Aspergillus heterothallicus]